MTFIIGLAGPAKVGKSTTANGIKEAFNYVYPNKKVCTFAFADSLYELSELLTGVPKEILRDQKYKEVEWTKETSPLPCLIGWTPRKFLQIVGTEGIRNNINTNFWVECAIRKIKDYDIAISADARFDTEYKVCHLNLELERSGVIYACNHASAMPPDPKFIYKKINLYPGMDYKSIVALIMDYKEQKGL